MTNKAVREFTLNQFPKNPAITEKLGVKVKMEIHLDPDHQAFILFEAPNAEAVRDYLVEGGYAHFSRLSFHLVTPISELIKQVEKMPTVY